MRFALKVVAFWIVAFLALRGAVSFLIPMGLECYGGERACVAGPGVVGVQKCWGGKWWACEPKECRR